MDSFSEWHLWSMQFMSSQNFSIFLWSSLLKWYFFLITYSLSHLFIHLFQYFHFLPKIVLLNAFVILHLHAILVIFSILNDLFIFETNHSTFYSVIYRCSHITYPCVVLSLIVYVITLIFYLSERFTLYLTALLTL